MSNVDMRKMALGESLTFFNILKSNVCSVQQSLLFDLICLNVLCFSNVTSVSVSCTHMICLLYNRRTLQMAPHLSSVSSFIPLGGIQG